MAGGLNRKNEEGWENNCIGWRCLWGLYGLTKGANDEEGWNEDRDIDKEHMG